MEKRGGLATGRDPHFPNEPATTDLNDFKKNPMGQIWGRGKRGGLSVVLVYRYLTFTHPTPNSYFLG